MAACAKCVHVEVCKDYIKAVLDDFDDSKMCGDDRAEVGIEELEAEQ